MPSRPGAHPRDNEPDPNHSSAPSTVETEDTCGAFCPNGGSSTTSEQRRVGARSAFDSPGQSSYIITRPLTPTGTHLAGGGSDGIRDGIAIPSGPIDVLHEASATLKRQRTNDEGGRTGGDPSKSARTEPNGPKTSILRDRQVDAFRNEPYGLPAEKGFPIQIGSELFRLSGASIMSDAPSYFSKFFQEQLRQPDNDSGAVKTLYIDRDPVTFQDIALHLQGYFIKPRDGMHYVRLFSDAQFYSLPKLIKQLFKSDICMRIGERDFQIPRDMFLQPGNSPNYFTLGFAIFGGETGEVFPGLERENLFRPPSVDPPTLLTRSSETFAEILDLIRGYPVKIRSAEHRKALLCDCRYYHFRGLEQALLPCLRSYDMVRGRHEIVMRLEDIRQSGLSFVAAAAADDMPAYPDGERLRPDARAGAGWVHYARPFVDDASAELILEVGPGSARLRMVRGNGRITFVGKEKARLTSLLNVLASKMELPGASTIKPSKSGLSTGPAATTTTPVEGNSPGPGSTPLADEDSVRAYIGCAAHVVLDGAHLDGSRLETDLGPYLTGTQVHWSLRRAHFRLCLRPRQSARHDMTSSPGAMEVLCALAKVDAISEDEKGYRAENRERAWVGVDADGPE